MILEEVCKPIENQSLLAAGTGAYAPGPDPFALPFIK